MQLFRESSIRQFLSTLITAALLSLSVAPMAAADVVTTDDILQSTQLAEKRAEVHNFMAREDVRETLLGYGVSDADITSRIDALTDAEILQMHEQIENMPAGGVFGTIIAILVIFILLDIAGVTDIFPRI